MQICKIVFIIGLKQFIRGNRVFQGFEIVMYLILITADAGRGLRVFRNNFHIPTARVDYSRRSRVSISVFNPLSYFRSIQIDHRYTRLPIQ